ncbi:TPA: AAA family ATPase [Yersinia enterocolitica]|uniref:AAA family ATPase n=1 Tax=Yersinia mollaretii TaxID=33060 RepID=UPI0011A7EF23|nr:AAA family ATPase [Yersinia mollaretii]ELI8051011.1 AAA family ATPase [Yersinia enterocolitica]HDL7102888.1 AAA family ATPase [Yersinia enterocolitica]HDL7173112.1 AAA family ATPase [Yersinia enterocolitica]
MTATETFPIESFRMTQVHGYKDITMVMKGKTTIFVSENGAGKTTVLNAIRLLLEQDYQGLMRINFKSIFIKLAGKDEIEIKNERDSQLPVEEVKSFMSERLFINISFWEDHDIRKYTRSIIDSKNNEYRDSLITHDIYARSKFPEEFINHYLNELKERITSKAIKSDSLVLKSSKGFNKNQKIIHEALSGLEIVFLPTYRRVEKSFNDSVKDERELNRRSGFRRIGIKLHKDGISYGLKDVEEALKELTLNIERTSNLGYRSLSAKMLEDLINYGNNTTIAKLQNGLPLIEDLERFLSRVEDSGANIRARRESSNKKAELISSLKDLYTENKIKDITYLEYFLSQLNVVIQETKEQEYKIERFVDVCNKYLTSSGDSKSLQFDPKSLEVIVSDNFTDERIFLNDLSSGEKQVISLMATIYLNDSNHKIILIDEPELSLSIDWQRMILPDLNSGENVKQIIAITHSPFIFDNDLDTCATAMKIKKVRSDEQ